MRKEREMKNVGYCLSLLWNGILFLALNDDFNDLPFIKDNISTTLAVSSKINFKDTVTILKLLAISEIFTNSNLR